MPRQQPCSMLVSALMGTDRMKTAYADAIENGYRSYSYGHASLLLSLRLSGGWPAQPSGDRVSLGGCTSIFCLDRSLSRDPRCSKRNRGRFTCQLS